MWYRHHITYTGHNLQYEEKTPLFFRQLFTNVIRLQSSNTMGSRQNMHLDLRNSLPRVEEKQNPGEKENAAY